MLEQGLLGYTCCIFKMGMTGPGAEDLKGALDVQVLEQRL